MQRAEQVEDKAEEGPGDHFRAGHTGLSNCARCAGKEGRDVRRSVPVKPESARVPPSSHVASTQTGHTRSIQDTHRTPKSLLPDLHIGLRTPRPDPTICAAPVMLAMLVIVVILRLPDSFWFTAWFSSCTQSFISVPGNITSKCECASRAPVRQFRSGDKQTAFAEDLIWVFSLSCVSYPILIHF